MSRTGAGLRRAAASEAGGDHAVAVAAPMPDYEVASVMIAASATSGSTMLTIREDGAPDAGSGDPEMLVLYGMVDGMQTNSVTFMLWDMAVPALPLIAQPSVSARVSSSRS